jgi:hypothetical protein
LKSFVSLAASTFDQPTYLGSAWATADPTQTVAKTKAAFQPVALELEAGTNRR